MAKQFTGEPEAHALSTSWPLMSRIAEVLHWLEDPGVDGIDGETAGQGQVLTKDRDLLCFLIGQRLATLAMGMALMAEKGTARDAVNADLALTPVNPVLLCSAIAQRALSGTDEGSVTAAYTEGAEVGNLYPCHFMPPDYGGDRQMLDAHFALEKRMLDALCVLAVARAMSHWPWPHRRRSGHLHPSTPPAEQWVRLAALKDPSTAAGIPDRETIRWEVWLLANPTYLARDFEEAWLPLIREGQNKNKITGRLERRMREEQREQIEAFNAALQAPGTPEEKRVRLLDGRPARNLAEARLRRAQRLYTWSAHEIEARWSAGIHRMGRNAEEAAR